MNFKPKFKPKLLLRRAVALFTAFSMCICLAVSASAFPFVGNSNSSAKYSFGSGFTYGFQSEYGQFVSWRMSLYVSTADDGKIDPKTASIVGQKGLGYVGSILYDNFTPYLTGDIYIQSSYTADMRAADLYNAAYHTVKAFPCVTKVLKTDPVLYGSAKSNYEICYSNIGKLTPDGDYIYHNTTNLYSLYNLPYLGSSCNGKVVEKAISSEDFTQQIIEDLNQHLGGSSSNFIPLYNKILDADACKVGTESGDKLDAAIAANGINGYKVLLPTNKDCVVQWCLVVEPIGEYSTMNEASFWEGTVYDPFWSEDDGDYTQGYFGLGSKPTVMGLDAYAVAQYNEKTKSHYAIDYLVDELRNHITGFKPSHYSDYVTDGKLIGEYTATNVNVAATMNYDCHTECNPYCGVYVAGSTSGMSYRTSPQYCAQFGGISVYVTDLEEDEGIPVYYYIYNDKNKYIRTETDSFNPKGDKNAKFLPVDTYGTPIADESHNKSADASPDGYKDWWNIRGGPSNSSGFLRETSSSGYSPKIITDAEGNPQTGAPVITDMTPVTTGLTVYSNYKNDFVKSIHVKVVQTPGVDVVYHVYNYIVPDDKYDSIKSLTGSDLEEAVKDLTPTVSSSKRTIAMTAANTSYKASTDRMATSYGKPIHVTAVLAGKEAALTNDHCPDYCDPGKRNFINGTSSPYVYKQNGTAVFRAEPTTVVNFNDAATSTGTRQIHVKIINIKKTPPAGQSPKDRIKTYDVTQLIEDTQQTATGSLHLTKPATQSCALF